jgi:hypothetical protein
VVSRLIFVTGTPSGGTSAIAGALHYLGVDMGKFPTNPGIRGYATYEDVNTHVFKLNIPGQGPTILRQGLRLRDYIAYRQGHAKKGQRIGVKASALYWMTEQSPGTLPIDWLVVHRPLEDAIESDQRIQAMIAEDRGRNELTPVDLVYRGAAIGGAFAAKDMICQVFDPALELDFYETLESPKDAVILMCEAFGLKPTPEQETAAVKFLDPNMRHV